MITDSKLDKLLKETIGENMVVSPSDEFTSQTIKAIGNSLRAPKPLISGKTFAIYGTFLLIATIILALSKEKATNPIVDSFKNTFIEILPNFRNIQFSLNTQVSQITLCACILILFQLTLLKKYILR